MRQEFRAAARESGIAVIDCLSQMRARSKPEAFGAVIAALKTYAPRQANLLFIGGPATFSGLVWARQSLVHQSLERELLWAAAWLQGQSNKINAFRRFSLRLQSLVMDGSITQSVEELDAFMKSHGWSLWGVELRCALGPMGLGVDAQRNWAIELHKLVPNSVPGLLLQIFTDRNDETLSHDAFYANCSGSLPRFKSVAEWLPKYLFYRALVSHDDPEATFITALCRDATSSLFDYYETLIESLKTISTQKSLRPNRSAALTVIESLKKDGFIDHRLDKLAVAFSGQLSKEQLQEQPGSLSDDLVALIYGKIANVDSLSQGSPVSTVIELAKACVELGVAASSPAASLLKFGLNFRGIDVGSALGMIPVDSSSNFLTSRVRSIDVVTLSRGWSLEDIAGLPDEAGRAALRQLSIDHDLPALREQCTAINQIVDGACIDLHAGFSKVMLLWIGRQFLISGRYDEARSLGENLEILGPQWQRHGAKLKMWALVREGRLLNSLEFAAEWLKRGEEYVSELPFVELFNGRDWPQFRDLDPVIVGLVAHHVHIATGKGAIGYICKMACRKFATSGYRSRLQELYDSSAEGYRELLVLFLRDAWTEENLSMNHLLQSTDDVRAERMIVCQTLLVWDSGRSQEYIDAIKLLTLDEALRKGLRHINQTRIFVNDSGISRWVERDLMQDFDRWLSLTKSEANGQLGSGLIRQYSVDPASVEFLMAIHDGKPTEADAQLTNMIDRIFRRFLTDPADGLDCYLSLRVRHGSLRGTLFGPLEEQALIYSSQGASRDAFDERWGPFLNLDEDDLAKVFALLQRFSAELRKIADELINDRVQIRSAEKPKGAIVQYVQPHFAQLFGHLSDGAVGPVSLDLLLDVCYYVFWRSIEPRLLDLANSVRQEVKEGIQREVDELVGALRALGHRTLPLVTAITTVGTTLQSQCDSIADWFRLPDESANENFKLSVAIEIARAATKNVYRAFPAEVEILRMPNEDPSLSTRTLVGLADALFVILENVWKRSGLGVWVGAASLEATLDTATGLLTVSVSNRVSANVRAELESGGLDELHSRYRGRAPTELANREGGSGFAKLALLCRSVDRSVCPEPINFGLSEGQWVTTFTMPLFEQDGVYEAFR